MKRIKRKNGFVLMLVVTMIPLVGMVIAIMTSNSKGLLHRTRTGTLQVHAQNACQSGLAWAKQNPGQIKSLTPEKPITLSLQNNNSQIYCLIEQTPGETGENVFQVTGYARDKRFSAKYSRPLTTY